MMFPALMTHHAHTILLDPKPAAAGCSERTGVKRVETRAHLNAGRGCILPSIFQLHSTSPGFAPFPLNPLAGHAAAIFLP